MGLIDKATLLAQLCPPIDSALADRLLDEFVSLERRYILRDWEPAELDGGQFAEILARILYHLDSGTLNLGKGFDDCVKYLEDNGAPHALVPRQEILHIALILRPIYKVRSQRGAVHISHAYFANEIDARIVVECVRWCFFETLRKFWAGKDREAVAKAIRELVQFDVPSVGKFGDIILVQRTHLAVDQEVLILLHYAGEAGFSRKEVGLYAKHPAPTVTGSLQRLASPRCRQIIQISSGNYRLTDLGSKRVREQMSDLLQLN